MSKIFLRLENGTEKHILTYPADAYPYFNKRSMLGSELKRIGKMYGRRISVKDESLYRIECITLEGTFPEKGFAIR